MAANPEVTGSCHLVVVKLPNRVTIKFIVDCGLYQESQYADLNRELPFNVDELDFALLTHNHVDHTGRFPYLYARGFRKHIYTTHGTKLLLSLGLFDSYRVLKDTAKRQNIRPLYSDSDVHGALSCVRSVDFMKEVEVHPNVKVTFFKNGHLIGAAIILVKVVFPGYNDINLLFVGDYNDKNMFFDVPPLPKEVTDLPLTIIQESTYGDMNSSEVSPCFENNVLEAISRGDTVVATMFSLGRGQEIPYVLKCMQQDGRLDTSVPIYYDGKLAINYTNQYLRGALDIKPEMRDFLPESLTFVDKSSRGAVLEDETPKIILTTSGMGSYGPAQTYIPRYIQKSKALIHFLGYCAEGTMGYKLKMAESDSDVVVGGMLVRKRARVEFTNEYSAHAKSDQMIRFLQQFTQLKFVLVGHGNTDVKIKFAAKILDEVDTKYVGILGREYMYRTCPYGFVKSLPTKLK